MSQQFSKKNSLRQTSIMKSKAALKLGQIRTDPEIRSFKKLPLIKQRKYSSSKNLVVSSTCEIPAFQQQFKISSSHKIKKTVIQKKQERHTQTEIDPINVKYFFQKRKNAIQPLDAAQLKKYSSCNKLISFPSIPQLGVPNDQSFIQNENGEHERQIKSSNSIKLQTIQYAKRPKLERIPFKKILKTQMSKTINPRKIQSQHSIQIQNEIENQQKRTLVKKRSKMSKCMFDRIDSKTKILVKNPFNRIPKKHSQMSQKFQIPQNIETLQKDFILSKIYEDGNNLSQLSLSGKSDIENLIGFMNI